MSKPANRKIGKMSDRAIAIHGKKLSREQTWKKRASAQLCQKGYFDSPDAEMYSGIGGEVDTVPVQNGVRATHPTTLSLHLQTHTNAVINPGVSDPHWIQRGSGSRLFHPEVIYI